MPPFSLTQVPLQDQHLIEASAGTGKTYNLVGLYLRLLFEKQLLPEQILTLSFTNNTCNELQQRLEDELLSFLAYLKTPPTPFVEKEIFIFLASRYEALTVTEKKQKLLHLENCWLELKAGRPKTIHGFAHSLLREFGLQAGEPPRAKISNTPFHFRAACLQAWRKQFLFLPTYFTAWLEKKKINFESFSALLQEPLSKGNLNLAAPNAHPKPSHSLETLYAALQSKKAQLRTLLRESSPQLQQTSLSNSQRTALENYCSAPLEVEFEKLKEKPKKKSSSLPPSSVEVELQALLQELQRCAALLCAAMHHTYRVQLHSAFLQAKTVSETLKRKADQWDYEALIAKVHSWVTQPLLRDRFAAFVNQKFQAVLVDEFQDVDGRQYEVLKRLFRSKAEYCTKPFFLIGDPKQLLYSFRGATLSTYLKAKADTPAAQHWKLEFNFRSAPQLLAALNWLYQQAKQPFGWYFGREEVKYYKVSVPAASIVSKIAKGDEAAAKTASLAPCLVAWQLQPPQGERLAVAQARQLALAQLVSSLVQLFEKNPTLSLNEIAVLVGKNSEVQLVKDALEKHSIPTVVNSKLNLYTTEEAWSLLIFLEAVAAPQEEEKIRSALATDFFSFSLSQLVELFAQEQQRLPFLEAFQIYAQRFQQQGFFVMFTAFMQEYKVEEKLLGLPRGRRRMINLMHLLELLAQQQKEQALTANALAAFLKEQIQNQTRLEEGEAGRAVNELRNDADEAGVVLSTVHQAKGLEYEVVFLPFTFSRFSGRNKNSYFVIETETGEQELVLKPLAAQTDRAEEQASQQRFNAQKAQLEEEAFAHELRLLYVGFTRAKTQLFFSLALNLKQPTLTPLMHLLGATSNSLLSRAAKTLERLQQESVIFRIEKVSSAAENNATELENYCYVSSWRRTAATTFTFSPFTRALPISYLTAFSSLSRNLKVQETSRAWQEEKMALSRLRPFDFTPREESLREENVLETAAPEKNQLQGGLETGLLVHQVFENLDFSKLQPAHLEQVVDAALEKFFKPSQWKSILLALLEKTLAVPLLSPKTKTYFTLRELEEKKTCKEMEFLLPIRTSFAHLKKKIVTFLKKQALLPTAAPLQSALPPAFKETKSGFLQGFIDLFFEKDGKFYLLDWKSNLLAAYSPVALKQEMIKQHYALQYYLYLSALHTYLRARLGESYSYEAHFGGVFYLFVRGAEAAPMSGVFAARPTEENLEAFCAFFT